LDQSDAQYGLKVVLQLNTNMPFSPIHWNRSSKLGAMLELFQVIQYTRANPQQRPSG